ncbi:FixH family protein [Aneurinibacillus sp. REN35]|uniref:FixH family protein n=1 Tax=Aneurinibacillus sp. REN35 TaxID=3237286 RepID=UPI003528C321
MKHNRCVWTVLLLFIATIVVAGCSNEKPPVERSIPEKLTVQFAIAPVSPKPKQEAALSVAVEQGGEKVEDAEEVKFEVWREGQTEAHTMIPANKSGEGRYGAVYRFEQAGVYYVMYHIDARSLHAMQKHKVIVK